MDFMEEANLEHTKQQLDYIKHMTTLSTGSILLLTTFLEKLFVRPHWKLLIVISFAGFTISVLASVLVHTIYVHDNQFFVNLTLPPTFKVKVYWRSNQIMWCGFLIGILSLSIFAVRNLL